MKSVQKEKFIHKILIGSEIGEKFKRNKDILNKI